MTKKPESEVTQDGENVNDRQALVVNQKDWKGKNGKKRIDNH